VTLPAVAGAPSRRPNGRITVVQSHAWRRLPPANFRSKPGTCAACSSARGGQRGTRPCSGVQSTLRTRPARRPEELRSRSEAATIVCGAR
jgi:hypothetical protein